MGYLNACLRGFFLVASGIAVAGSAAESGNETVWACRYEGSTSVLCQLIGGAASEHPMADETPRGHRALSPLVRMINRNPALLANHTVRIPLHNHAHNMEAVEQLADAVMCGGRSDCHVQFERRYQGGE